VLHAKAVLRLRLERLWRLFRSSDKNTLAFAAAWLLCTVVALIPVWHQRMLPMLDTPDHLALARAWHDYRDPSSRIADFYLLRVRLVPYVMFYWLTHVLLYVVRIETANKLLLSAYLILFPLSVLSLARALGRSRWLALGGFAVAFNPGWIYGFSSYLLGTCFLFFGWAALIVWLEQGRRRAAVAVGVTTLLAYSSHVMAWTLFGAGAIGLLIIERRRWRRVLVAAAAMTPSLMLAALAWVQEKRAPAYMKYGEQFVAVWKDVPRSLIEFPKRVMELFPGNLDMWALATLAATTIALLVWPRRARPATPDAARRLGTLVAILGFAYLMLPYAIKQPMSWWYVAPRVPALMAPLLLLLPSANLDGWRCLAMAPVLAACLALPIKLTALYTDFNRRNFGFMRLVDRLPRGATTLVLARGLITGDPEVSGDAASSAPVYWHFMSWPMALKGGFSPYLFDQGIPVQPRPTTPHYNVARSDSLDFRSAPEFDYYLVHASSDARPEDRHVREEETLGAWTLYHRIALQSDEP
jgi:hypothetical protein